MFRLTFSCLLTVVLTLSGTSAAAFSVNLPSHIPSEYVDGPAWSTFEIYSKSLSSAEVQAACGKGRFHLADTRPDPTLFLGCSVVSFALRQCHFVYVSGRTDASEHERQHCRGYDHPPGDPHRGVTGLAAHWQSWNRAIGQESLTLQRRGLSDEEVVRIVASKAISIERVVLERMKLPSTAERAKRQGWRVEMPSTARSKTR